MSILSSNQIESIKNTIKKVTDSFFITPVRYYLVGGSLDRFNEDRKDMSAIIYNLNGLVEYGSSMKVERRIAGGMNESDIKISFNYKDIIMAGLADGNNGVKMNASKDYMVINNHRYQVTHTYVEGPIEAENVILVVMGKLDQKNT